MRGTGWHRCVFIMFEHNTPIDFGFNDVENTNQISFEKRSFDSKEFFSKYERSITPVGLSFFQTEWDLSVRNFFHNTLSK